MGKSSYDVRLKWSICISFWGSMLPLYRGVLFVSQYILQGNTVNGKCIKTACNSEV